MANLSISKISQRIFNATKHETTVARSSNPFAKSSFKGNVLTADVFESSTNVAKEIAPKNKLALSTFVGAISDLGSKIKAGIESINAFGTRMKENVVNTWNKLNDINVGDVLYDTGKTITTNINKMFENTSPKALAKRPISELRDMFIEAENNMVHAAA